MRFVQTYLLHLYKAQDKSESRLYPKKKKIGGKGVWCHCLCANAKLLITTLLFEGKYLSSLDRIIFIYELIKIRFTNFV